MKGCWVRISGEANWQPVKARLTVWHLTARVACRRRPKPSEPDSQRLEAGASDLVGRSTKNRCVEDINIESRA